MSFARSERKVATGITPKKVKGESRNDSEIENTVKNTLHSAWTPTKGGTLNNQLFEERKNLIGHWFENWNDGQRRQFLEHLVDKFNKMSVHFVHNMIKDMVPPPPTDFTRVLPQHLSLKILGYLDPRSLAQASLVSWHWKWLCEHDAVWKPKCQKRGWDLKEKQSPHERAVWKRHYQKKVWAILHPEPPPRPPRNGEIEEDGALNTSGLSGGSAASRLSAGSTGRKKTGKAGTPGRPKSYKLGDSSPLNVGYLKHKEQEQAPWRSNDKKPKDIQLFNKQILGISSENVPKNFSDKFTKVEIARTPARSSANPLSRSQELSTRKSGSKEGLMNGLQSKSMVAPSSSPRDQKQMLKSKSSTNITKTNTPRAAPTRKISLPAAAKRNAQGPRKNDAMQSNTMKQAAARAAAKKSATTAAQQSESSDVLNEVINIPTAWKDGQAARKVASTDTLGSDAALDQESNDSLYGDDSGKLSGEGWELHSNISDQ